MERLAKSRKKSRETVMKRPLTTDIGEKIINDH